MLDYDAGFCPKRITAHKLHIVLLYLLYLITYSILQLYQIAPSLVLMIGLNVGVFDIMYYKHYYFCILNACFKFRTSGSFI